LVARLFLLEGIAAVVGMAVSLSQGHLLLDLTALGIPMSFGLVRGSRGWRTWALVNLWLGMLASPFLAITIAMEHEVYLSILGIPIQGLSPIVAYPVVAASFALALWQYRTLTREDVRAAFQVGAYGRAELRTPLNQPLQRM